MTIPTTIIKQSVTTTSTANINKPMISWIKSTILLFVITSTRDVNAENEGKAVKSTSIIFEDHGIMLKPQGYITFSTDNMLSLFRKLHLPSMSQFDNCKSDVQNNFNIEILKTTLDYIELFNNIVRPMPRSNETNSQSRNKRQLLAFGIGLGIVDLLFGGISYGTLNHHINQLDRKFGEFVTKQHDFDNDLLEWDNQLITMIEKSHEEIDQKFRAIQCQILESTGELLAMQYVDRWIKTLDNVFRPLTEGRMKTRLTPHIVKPADLNRILSEHPMLKGSFYSRNVYNFYKVASVSVVQAQFDIYSSTLSIHQIIHYPALKPHHLFPMFVARQVGIIRNQVCLLFEIPRLIYTINDKFYAVDETNCVVSDTVTTCYAEIFNNSEQTSCLTNLTTCDVLEGECTPKYVYDTSGILIGTAVQNIQVFEKKQDKKGMRILKPNKYGTRFIPWTGISYIQMEGLLVEEPSYISTNIIYNSSELALDAWEEQLNASVWNITRLRKSLERLTTRDPDKNQITWEQAVLLTMVAALVFGAAVTGGYCLRTRKLGCNTNSQYGRAPVAETKDQGETDFQENTPTIIH